MSIIKELEETQYVKLKINHLRHKLAEKMELKTSIKSAMSTEIAVGSHVAKFDRGIDSILASIEEIEQEINRNIVIEEQLMNHIEDKIQDLPPKERMLIKLHYCHGETLEYISEVIGCTPRHIVRKHKEVLNKLSVM